MIDNYFRNQINSINKHSHQILRLTLLFFTLILNLSSFSQKAMVGTDYYLTGNGHGVFYSPYFCIYKNNNTFSFGPVIQQSSMLMQGAKFTYSHRLTHDTTFKSQNGEKELLQLNFFSSLQYTHALPLAGKTLKDEKMIWGDKRPDLDNLLLSTGELNIGFELYLNITKRISWKNYFGASVYYNFNYSEILEHQQCSPSLNLGTGLCFFL